MNLKDVVSLSFEALADRKIRTVLTVLMVVLGSSLVVILNGLSAGQAAFLEKQFNTLAANVLYVSNGARGFRSDSSTSIIINDVILNKIKSLPFVNDAVPQYSGSAQVTSQGNTERASITAMDPTKLTVLLPNIDYVDGSMVRGNDRASALVGDTVANPPGAATPFVTLGETIQATATYSNPGGKTVTVSKNFVVSGILKPSGNMRTDNSIIINLDAGNQLLHKSNKYDQIIVAATTPDDVDTVQQEITGLFGTTLGVTSPKAIMAVRLQAANGTAAFNLMIGIIALIVGSVGIVTTLYNSVTERIREIGTMKAIGAQNSFILALFLIEASLIGIMGASLGIAIGVVGGYVMSIFTTSQVGGGFGGAAHIPPIYNITDLVNVWLLSLTLSIIAGIFPAWKASRLSPMVALRRE
jgi:putative ABC transport system permease protein